MSDNIGKRLELVSRSTGSVPTYVPRGSNRRYLSPSVVAAIDVAR